MTNAYSYFLKPNAVSLLGVLDKAIGASLNGANIGRHKLYSSDGISTGQSDSLVTEIELNTNTAKDILLVADETYGILKSGFAIHLLDPAMFTAEGAGVLPAIRVANDQQHAVCSRSVEKLVKYCDEIKSASKKLGEGLRILEVLNNTNWELKREISDLFTQLGNLASNLSLERDVLERCLQEYRNYLDSMKRDSERIGQIQRFLTKPMIKSINTKELLNAKKKLDTFQTMYINNLFPLRDIADAVLASNLEDMVDDIVNFVNFNIKDPIKKHTEQQFTYIADEYRTALTNIVLYSKYFNNSVDTLRSFHNMHILRIPRVDLSTGSRYYQKTSTDSSRTTPSDIEVVFSSS